MMALARLQRHGHSPIAIVGGGTGMIGDPSGKTQERPLLSREEIERTSTGSAAARAIPRLRHRHQSRPDRQQRRLAGDVRSARISSRHGQVLHRQLHAAEGVGKSPAGERGRDLLYRVQLPAAAGARLSRAVRSLRLHACRWAAAINGATSPRGSSSIRKLRGDKVHGLVSPLVTTASGTKFGKTEAGHYLAGSGKDLAVPLLPVLAECRRPGRRPVFEVLHLPRARGDRVA